LTFVKQPGLGGSVAWHQDGVTHWNSSDLDEGTHGFFIPLVSRFDLILKVLKLLRAKVFGQD
jgi:hypothetical protein